MANMITISLLLFLLILIFESTPVVPWLSYSRLDPRLAGLNPAGVDGFSERKNPEYDFLRKGSKAEGPVS